MKKKILFPLLLFPLLLAGCGEQHGAGTDRPEWLSDLYSSNYAYRKTTCTIQDEQTTTLSIMEGKVVSSPYREYIRVVFPEDSVWSEAYFYGSGKQIDAKLYTRVQGVVDQKTSRVYPYGYKEASNFSPEGTEEKDGKTFDVYTSEYQVNLNETLGLPDSYDILNAPVSQKYYVDPDNDTVSYICTDLTDLQGRSSLALDIAYGDLSEAEASRILEEDQTRHIEILEILETGDSVEVTVP